MSGVRSLFVDFPDGFARERAPRRGDFLQAIGKRGLGSQYFVLQARQVQRKDPVAAPRILMQVQRIDECMTTEQALNTARALQELFRSKGRARLFEFHWYSRARKRPLAFEQELKQALARRSEA